MNYWSLGRAGIGNIIATVALVTIFSAGSAAAALVVRSTNIVDGEVKTVDLANGAVTNAKIAANTVTGAKIDETSLGIVPNANLLDGKDSTAFVTGPGRVISGRNVTSVGDSVYVFLAQISFDVGFNIASRCSSDQIYFTNMGSANLDIWYRHNGDDPIYTQVAPNATYTATETDGPHLVTVHVAQPGSDRQASLEYSVYEIAPTAENPFGHCFSYGEAVLNF